MKSFLEWVRLLENSAYESDEIRVVASDDETFDKYGDEIDFVIDVTWSVEGQLEDFEEAQVKQASLGGKPMVLTPDLMEFGIKKLKEGWSRRYAPELGERWDARVRDREQDYPDTDD